MKDADHRPIVSGRANENAAAGRLPYVIEIWNLPRTAVERVIARAETLQTASALFAAAISENPSRRIVMRQGEQVIRDQA